MSDEKAALRKLCNDYLREYHSANVPPSRLDEPDRGGDGVRIAGPDMLVITPNNAPAAVAVQLRRMFDADPVWWSVFLRELAQWTPTPPTTPGWYWVWNGHAACVLHFVYDDEEQLVYATATGEYIPAHDSGMAWMGPVSVPAPPECK